MVTMKDLQTVACESQGVRTSKLRRFALCRVKSVPLHVTSLDDARFHIDS